MKNIKFKFIASVMAGAALVSCNDLDTAPMGATITSDQKEETIAANPDRIDASVTAITSMFSVYANILPNSFGHEDYGFASAMLGLDSRGTDLVSEDTGYNWYTRNLNFADVQANGRPTRMAWATLYNQIYTANNVTSVIDPETEDAKLKFSLAQALAIRAFDYFWLVQLYQHTYVGNQDKLGVPIITEANQTEAAANGCARSTVEEVYAQVMTDLDKAISLLEDAEAEGVTRDDNRYVSKEVAYGIRARVNLVMNNWSAAAADAQKAIDGSGAPYSMEDVAVPGFTDIEDWMWGILISETDRVVTSGIVNWPSHMGSLNYGYASVGAWRMVNQKLYAMIADSDVRKGWFLDENGLSVNLSAAQQAYVTEEAGCPPYTQMKFGPYNGEIYTSTNACDIPLMRVEEMYLILAEAQAMGGNAAQGATTLQNFVQTYRDAEYTCTATTAEAVQDAVWTQRRIELWGEGLSYFDIMRLKKGVDRRGCGFQEAYVFNVPASDAAMIYPIPEAEMQANSLMEQNPVATIPQPVTE